MSNVASGDTKVVPLTCHGHSRPVTHLSFSNIVDDGEYYIISACKDNNPMLRDGVTGDWIGTFIGHKGAVWQSRIASDASLAATGSADFSAKVWDTHTGDCLHTLQHSHIVRAVAFPSTPRPEVIATGGFEKKLRIFDLNRSSSSSRSASPTSPVASNGNTTSNISAPTPGHEIGPGVHTGIIKSIAWGSDPAILITACDDKKIRWWDLRVRSPITSYDLDGGLGTCELNDFALSVAAGKTAYFFSPTVPGQLLRDPVKTPYEIASVAVHGEKRKFVTGGSINNTWVRVYDLDTEQELDTNKGHHGPIWSVAFSPDGKLYATGSEDGTIKLWKFVEGPFGLWK